MEAETSLHAAIVQSFGPLIVQTINNVTPLGIASLTCMDLVTCMSKNSVITMQEINTVVDALQAPMAHFEDLLVTLAGYCVHSTVVPAIVPIFFSPPTEQID